MTTKLPEKDESVDQQLVQILGPDGLKDNYQYDAETNTYYNRRGTIVVPSSHGHTHVGDDPVPVATVERHGLMDRDDKAKLDAILQMRIGVVGFSGAGFPDDGGFLDGTVLFGAGDGIVIEKIGNLVRWTLANALPVTCGLEECAKIFWIQDETAPTLIRPPTCAGKLFGVSVPGEIDVTVFPEGLIVNSSDPSAILNTRSSYPGFKIKRYKNAAATPNLARADVILERNSSTTTKVGWAMTPGPLGVVECVWFVGHDEEGNQLRFELTPSPVGDGTLSDPDLLGSLIYNGHTLTRQMAVVTDYTVTTTSRNDYVCRFWSVDKEKPVGETFIATNVWKYDNPENAADDLSLPKAIVKDITADILPVGALVQIWEFQIEEVNGNRIVRRYFNKEPKLNPAHLFATAGMIRFGHVLGSREEVSPGAGETDLTAFVEQSEDIRLLERDQWGITGFDDPVLLSDDLEETASELLDTMITEVVGQSAVLPLPNVEFRVVAALTVNALVGDYVQFNTLPDLDGREFPIDQNSTDSITIRELDPDELEAAIASAGGLPVSVSVISKDAIVAPSALPVNNRFVANIDTARPALVVENAAPDADRELPVFIWHRGSHKNVYVRALVGMPESSQFPPIDVLLRAPVDSFDDVYMQVLSRGSFSSGPLAGRPYIKVAGVSFRDLPKTGTLRILTGIYRDTIWKYDYKIAFGATVNGDGLLLVGQPGYGFTFDEDFVPGDSYNNPTDNPTETPIDTTPDKTTIVQLLRHDYTSPCLRIESSVNNNTGSESVQMQFKAGILDMSEPYELNLTNPKDNFVRGLRPGEFTVSRIYTQDGFITTGVETPEATPSGFAVYYGGTLPAAVNGRTEIFNELELLFKEDQLWVFWNGLLITPDAESSAALAEPVAVNTPYFPITTDLPVGKVAFRLWPGAVIREIEVRDQIRFASEYMYGQVELTDTGTGTGSTT
jgi:hypothetical protein